MRILLARHDTPLNFAIQMCIARLFFLFYYMKYKDKTQLHDASNQSPGKYDTLDINAGFRTPTPLIFHRQEPCDAQ